MTKIILTGWREGLKKVSLARLQTELLGMSMKASKENVDSLLNDEQVTIETNDEDLAKEFLKKADIIGAICKLEPVVASLPPFKN